MKIVYGGWEKRQPANSIPKKGVRALEMTTLEKKMMFTYRITHSLVTHPTCDMNQSLHLWPCVIFSTPAVYRFSFPLKWKE